MNASSVKPAVVVLGGGFGGLETATYLRRKLGETVSLTLVSDHSHFLYHPSAIYIPFGKRPERLMFPLERALARRGIEFVHGRVLEVDPDARLVTVERKGEPEKHAYDYLIIATGAQVAPTEVPGLEEFGGSLWKSSEMQQVGSSFHKVLDLARSGQKATTLFVVTQDNKWSGPAYEVAWMFDTWLRRRSVRKSVDIGFLTAEPGVLSVLGGKVQGLAEREFVGRGIGTQSGVTLQRVEPNSAHFLGPAGEEIEREFDALVASPAYVSSVRYESLPSDERGFVLTEGGGSQRVRGWSNIYVAGDAGDFPVKQGSLAAYQSVAAAEALAADISGGKASYSFAPVLVAALEEFDKALYVQAPLVLTGDATTPVSVRPGRGSSYRAATGRIWRLPKMSLAFYFPFRYRRGLPSHAGIQFTGIQLGRKFMARLLAR